jgi:hypothetical protein
MDGTLSATPTSRHHPRKRVIQYSRDSSYRTETPRRTGYPAFAGYDGCWFRASAIKRACYPTGKSMRPAPGGLASPFNKNILIFRIRKSVYIHSHPASQEGRFAVVTDVGCGMRWTLITPLTNGAKADGEVVWS